MNFLINNSNEKGHIMKHSTLKNTGLAMMALVLISILVTGCGGRNTPQANGQPGQQSAQTLNNALLQGQTQGSVRSVIGNNSQIQGQPQGGFQNGQLNNNRPTNGQPQGLGQAMSTGFQNGQAQPNQPQGLAQQSYGQSSYGNSGYGQPMAQPNNGWNMPQNSYNDPYFGNFEDCGCFDNFEDYGLKDFGEDVEELIGWINPFDDNENSNQATDYYWMNDATGMVVVTQSPQPPAQGFVLAEQN